MEKMPHKAIFHSISHAAKIPNRTQRAMTKKTPSASVQGYDGSQSLNIRVRQNTVQGSGQVIIS
jgi:hypothetical protein